VINLIIPVLNEKKNLASLVERIHNVLKKGYSIIFIDDGSKDGTLELAKKLSEKRPIQIYQRKKVKKESERGAALQFGLQKALQLEGDIFVEMDGDLSHRPEDILPALKALEKDGADMVIGSKYHKLSEVWGRHWFRNIISVFASFITGMAIDSHIRDWSNGLRMYNRSVALRISRLRSHYCGPSFLPESLAAILNEGFRVEEIPSRYENRLYGESKLKSLNVIKALAAVFEIAIRYHFLGFIFENSEHTETKIISAAPFQRQKKNFIENILYSGLALVFAGQVFFLPDHMDVDPLGLANPVFQQLKYGAISYPIHGFDNAMVVHPPFFYWMVAFLHMLGVPFKFAIGAPAFIAFVILLKVLSSSPFLSFREKVLLPLGIPVAASVMGSNAAALRPDLPAFCFLASGALILALAYREQWGAQKTFLGTTLLVVGANLHYVYLPCILGLIPLFFIQFRLGKSKNVMAQAALIAALVLTELVFIATFYGPKYNEIATFLKSFPPWEGFVKGWNLHREFYFWFSSSLVDKDPASWAMKNVTFFGLPVVIFSSFLLFFPKFILTVPILCLTPFLFYLLISTRKHGWYFLSDWFVLYLVMITPLVFASQGKFRKITSSIQNAIGGGVVVLFVIGFFQKNPPNSWNLKINTPMEIVRSDLRDIIGSNQKIGGAMQDWFITGGDEFYEIVPDLTWSHNIEFDLKSYLNKFDWISCSWPMSNFTLEKNGLTLSSLIVERQIQPKIFVFFSKNPAANFVLCKPAGETPEGKDMALVLEYGPQWQATKRIYSPQGSMGVLGLVGPQKALNEVGLALGESMGQGHKISTPRPSENAITTLLLNPRYNDGAIAFLLTKRQNLFLANNVKEMLFFPLGNKEPLAQTPKSFASQTNLLCLPRYSQKPERKKNPKGDAGD